MARIKSTLDLIMEKTKHLSLNDKEKKAFEQQQLIQRVQVPLSRYLKEERDADYLVQELDHLPTDKREEGRRLCLELCIDRLSAFEDNTQILAGVERLVDAAEIARWKQTVASLEEQYREDLNEARKQNAERCREALGALGLKGSALVPCVDERSPSWKEEQERRDKAFRASVRTGLSHPQR
jgi:hypothetical protein